MHGFADGRRHLRVGNIKKLVLAWDSDFTKLTPAELEEARKEIENGKRNSHDAINWD